MAKDVNARFVYFGAQTSLDVIIKDAPHGSGFLRQFSFEGKSTRTSLDKGDSAIERICVSLASFNILRGDDEIQRLINESLGGCVRDIYKSKFYDVCRLVNERTTYH